MDLLALQTCLFGICPIYWDLKIVDPWQFWEFCDLFGMVSSREPFKGCYDCLVVEPTHLKNASQI